MASHGWLAACCATCLAATAVAQPPPEGPPAKAAAPAFPEAPRVGGHFGIALPILAIDNDGTTVIGRDFVQVGLTPGITVKLSERWAVDFEFIGFSRWERGRNGALDHARTIFVVDPGVVYNFGPVAAGLRLAVQIGETIAFNFGVVPILVVPFALTSRLSYFIELDLPTFVFVIPATQPNASDRVLGNFNVLFQTGFAF